jgi:hypothetical protein
MRLLTVTVYTAYELQLQVFKPFGNVKQVFRGYSFCCRKEKHSMMAPCPRPSTSHPSTAIPKKQNVLNNFSTWVNNSEQSSAKPVRQKQPLQRSETGTAEIVQQREPASEQKYRQKP